MQRDINHRSDSLTGRARRGSIRLPISHPYESVRSPGVVHYLYLYDLYSSPTYVPSPKIINNYTIARKRSSSQAVRSAAARLCEQPTPRVEPTDEHQLVGDFPTRHIFSRSFHSYRRFSNAVLASSQAVYARPACACFDIDRPYCVYVSRRLSSPRVLEQRGK